jgi:hypothetical protein
LLLKRALAPDDLARAGVGVPPWRSWDLVAIPPLLPPTIGRIDGRFNTRPLRSASPWRPPSSAVRPALCRSL